MIAAQLSLQLSCSRSPSSWDASWRCRLSEKGKEACARLNVTEELLQTGGCKVQSVNILFWSSNSSMIASFFIFLNFSHLKVLGIWGSKLRVSQRF